MPRSSIDSDPLSRPLVSVRDFHKAYQSTVAVAGLSFALRPGQIFGLVGPNGAGKTTTMRAISGIIPPSRGQLEVAGVDVALDPVSARRQLAYIPDDPQLFPDLTVLQHLAFTASAYSVADASRKSSELLTMFELTGKQNTPARDLSRGMRQKLAICCAYLHDPVVLLFDEPLTGLDPRGIRTLKQSIRDRAAAGAAVMISSHLLAIVEDMCTEILILDHGQPKFLGTLPELRESFAHADVGGDLERLFFLATETTRGDAGDSSPLAVVETGPGGDR